MELESMRQNFFIKMLHSYQGDAGCQLHKPEMMDAHVGQPFLFQSSESHIEMEKAKLSERIFTVEKCHGARYL